LVAHVLRLVACVQDSIQLLASHVVHGAGWAAALCRYCTLSCAYCDKCRDARMRGFSGASADAVLMLMLFTEDF
jgi:hypothetical protein